MYGSDVDITNYVNGHRVTLNPLPDVNGGDEGKRGYITENRLIFLL